MDQSEKKELQKKANLVRQGVLTGTNAAKCGHPGGSLSAADMLTYLYFRELNVSPESPDDADRDRFVLSKGHAAPALYAVLALKGYFSQDELLNLRQIGSFLQGHPCMTSTPGVDMSTGSLGQGFSAAVGMALSAKLRGKSYRVYTVLGDGELGEGQVWEAAMFAPNKGLTNLVAIVDNNNLQIDGTVEEVNSPYPIDKKFEAFGWNVINIDGHDFDQIENALNAAKECTDKPTAIIMKTVKGKGVSFMENVCGWHGKSTNQEEYEIAMAELRAAYEQL